MFVTLFTAKTKTTEWIGLRFEIDVVLDLDSSLGGEVIF